jgi:predicted adenine nucleotide alpha hydrolase (AANH) superfamily ATPase
MKLLMHICCANCCLYPLKTLFSKNIEVKGLWLNPNIHPYTEYQMRLDSLQKLQSEWNLDIEYIDHYGLKEFMRTVVHHEDNRCSLCYSMRLEAAAKTAKKMGLDGFTTSLLVSPYQKFDMIINVGIEMGKKYSIPFYPEDFRPGWKNSISVSRKLGLYRQKYCGCVYSEMERYLKKESRQ